MYFFFYENEGDLHLEYMLDIRSSVSNKLCEDGALVPKHVGVGT